MSDINKGRYYSHDMGPYPYNWKGFAQQPDRASGQGMGLSGQSGCCPGLAAGPEGFNGTFDLSQRSTTDLVIAAASAYYGYSRSKITKKPIVNAAIMGGLALLAPLLTGAYVGYKVYEAKGK